ncbi:CDGSH iron-sulfur domain-containing protein [Hyphobacterium sp.]|jgi:CDGSH-type Zn-finger protein/uncharacterized Fe-S cluster protein YjdI|uniref:CDGSH iron-sulfur domain-containing protein n=1 Tax=Hyphobacterium sp. TaxID=2004662 RepID=UPI003BACCFA6
MPRERVSTYTGDKVEIVYDRDKCIHAAECGRGSGVLFDASKDPWCDPDAVDADTALSVVARCPTGALTARRLDGEYTHEVKGVAQVQVNPDGPLYVAGDLTLDGKPAHPRLALCRCGASRRKPLCDRSHGKIDFKDSGPVNCDPGAETIEAGPLKISSVPDGPVMIEGPFELRAASGRVAMRGKRAALCRCGQSKNKPFCDGSHTEAGFKSG